ncbi:MAG: hypothetical protein WCV79_01320 [Candidatus Paceibacterota bacterium]|jgi:hypothetical protein
METIFANKEMTRQITVPKKGIAGWRKSESGVAEELIFTGEEWMRVRDYRSACAERKQRNIEFYNAHPDLLRRKIDGCGRAMELRRARRGTECAIPYHAWM